MKLFEFSNINDIRLRLQPSENENVSYLINLANISAFQIYFEGAKGNESDYQIIYNTAYEIIRQIILEEEAYLIALEHNRKYKNKIRTYKGILRKENLSNNQFLEKEFDYNNNESLIASIQQLNSKNYYENIELLGDQRNSFIIISRRKLLTEEILDMLIRNHLIDSSLTMINYKTLLSEFCSKGDKLVRIGGDGGDNNLSIEIFFLSDEIIRVKSILFATIQNNKWKPGL